jgi:hypothetical protein
MSESAAAISDAVAAVSSVSGAVEAVANAPATISNFFVLGERLFYGAGYTVTFAIVFPAALAFAAIPKGNALVRGMIHGSAAARGRADRMLA